ncbi:MAG: hypothetical protein AAGD06_25375 [Acidobacteriota bacterium]
MRVQLLLSAFALIVATPVFADSTIPPSTANHAAVDASAEATAEFQTWLRKARLAQSVSGRDLVELEIVARYRYFDDGGRTILDHTRIRDTSIWQQRDLGDGRLERFLGPEGAWLETPRGRMELEDDLRTEFEIYHCLRRLQLLSICAGLDGSVEPSGDDADMIWLRFERGGSLFARLGLDRQTALVEQIAYPLALMPSEDADMEPAPGDMALTLYRDHRNVDGWRLPHAAESFRGELATSTYEVVSAKPLFAEGQAPEPEMGRR